MPVVRVGAPLFIAALLIPMMGSATQAQRRTGRQPSIEIRGQVPTPQVVTVRPREVPAYSRQVLVPDFFSHNFWSSIVPPYVLVSQRQITGASPLDSTPAAVVSAGVPPAVSAPPAAAPAQVPTPMNVPSAAQPRDTVMTLSADRQRELEAIRLELERRKVRLDSLANVVKDIGKARTPPDTTRRPPQ